MDIGCVWRSRCHRLGRGQEKSSVSSRQQSRALRRRSGKPRGCHGKGHPSSENSKCKGPEVGCAWCTLETEGATVMGAKEVRRTLGEVTEWPSHTAPRRKHGRNLSRVVTQPALCLNRLFGLQGKQEARA